MGYGEEKKATERGVYKDEHFICNISVLPLVDFWGQHSCIPTN